MAALSFYFMTAMFARTDPERMRAACAARGVIRRASTMSCRATRVRSKNAQASRRMRRAQTTKKGEQVKR